MTCLSFVLRRNCWAPLLLRPKKGEPKKTVAPSPREAGHRPIKRPEIRPPVEWETI